MKIAWLKYLLPTCVDIELHDSLRGISLNSEPAAAYSPCYVWINRQGHDRKTIVVYFYYNDELERRNVKLKFHRTYC